METKILSKIFIGIFALVLLMNMASAVDLDDINIVSQPASVNHGAGSFDITFNLTNIGDAGSLDWTTSTVSHSATLDFDRSTISDGSTTDVTEDYVATISFEPNQAGTITGEISVRGEGESTYQTENFSIPIESDPSLDLTGGTIETNENNTVITIKNTGNTYLSNIELNYSSGVDVEFNNSGFGLPAGDTETVLVTLLTSRNTLALGDTSIRVNAASGTTSDSATVTLKNSYCECGNRADLEVTIDDISISGLGDEDVWYPLDKVEVELEIDNSGSWDIDNIEVEWGLYDASEQDFIIEETESDFNLDEGDDKKITIEFELENPEDYENGNYVFYVRATGEIDDSDSPYDGNETCAEDSKEVEIAIDNDLVAISEISMPATAFCNSIVEVFADVWNIGEDDQDDVVVRIFNSELGIDKEVTFDEIDALEKEELDFTFEVPFNAEEKAYTIKLIVYDEDGDVYETEEDEEAILTQVIEVAGGCVSNLEGDLLVNANIKSGGNSGEELEIVTEITNVADETKTFTIDASGYDEWAELKDINTTTLILEKDESAKILLTFDVNKGVSGSKSFDLLVSSDGQTLTQPVTTTITTGDSAWSKLKNALSQGNASVWGIAIINIILIIVIIVVVIRLLRK